MPVRDPRNACSRCTSCLAVAGALLVATPGRAGDQKGEEAKPPAAIPRTAEEVGRQRAQAAETDPAHPSIEALRRGASRVFGDLDHFLRPGLEKSRAELEVARQATEQSRVVRDRVSECLESHLERVVADHLGKSRAGIEAMAHRLDVQADQIRRQGGRIAELERQIGRLQQPPASQP